MQGQQYYSQPDSMDKTHHPSAPSCRTKSTVLPCLVFLPDQVGAAARSAGMPSVLHPLARDLVQLILSDSCPQTLRLDFLCISLQPHKLAHPTMVRYPPSAMSACSTQARYPYRSSRNRRPISQDLNQGIQKPATVCISTVISLQRHTRHEPSQQCAGVSDHLSVYGVPPTSRQRRSPRRGVGPGWRGSSRVAQTKHDGGVDVNGDSA